MAFSYDTAGSNNGTNLSTLTITGVTVGSGASALFALMNPVNATEGPTQPDLTGCTWDQGGADDELQQIVHKWEGVSDTAAQIYGINNPTSGTHDLTVTWPGTITRATITVWGVHGGSTSATSDVTNTDDGQTRGQDEPRIDLTPNTSNSLMIACMGHRANTTPTTPSSATGAIYNLNNNGDAQAGAYFEFTSTANKVLTWGGTYTGDDKWCSCAIEYQNATAPGQTVSATDGLFMYDGMEKTESKEFRDFLMLGVSDAITYVPSYVINTVTATDGITFNEDPEKAESKTVADELFLSEVRRSLIEKLVETTLMIDDGTVREIGSLIVDTLLVSDSRVSAIDKEVTASLLLSDAMIKAIEKIAEDGLFLLSSDDILKITSGGTSITETDGLLMFDAMIAQQEKYPDTDSLLLGDDAFRSQFKRLIDALLLGDSRRSAAAYTLRDGLMVSEQSLRLTDLTIQNRLLLSDLTVKALEKLRVNGLLLSDSSTQSQISDTAQALVFAVLKFVDLLGIVISNQPNMIGIELGYVH